MTKASEGTDGVLVCATCSREIEACAFCERHECGVCMCHRCVLIELREALAHPHEHGG